MSKGSEAYNIVWLKRDLRWRDHEALALAQALQEPTLVIFIFDPLYHSHPTGSLRHLQIQWQSLIDLKAQLDGQHHLAVFHGPSLAVFQHLCQSIQINKVFSYRESGVEASFKRDQLLQLYFKDQGVDWVEIDKNGVTRGRKNRQGWDEAWRKKMSAPLAPTGPQTWRSINPGLAQELEVEFSTPSHPELKHWSGDFQLSNESRALAQLEEFIAREAKGYQSHIGEPDLSRKTCSRLSLALAWGHLSIRQVFHRSRQAFDRASNKRDLAAFISRIHWHSHFMQKFEMEHQMEFRGLNRVLDKVEKPGIKELQSAWLTGQTGFPLIDAAMRAVKKTGYLNFRMRAMVVSFYSYHLWQPWRFGADQLAQFFLDYLPGIHYPQFQMQSGLTGINTLRVYNPVKQSLEKDPQAVFIKEWVPELRDLPLNFVHQPWLMSAMEEGFYNFKLGRDYPKPVINQEEAGKRARDYYWAMKKNPDVQAENFRILKRHTTAIREPDQRTQLILSKTGNEKES